MLICFKLKSFKPGDIKPRYFLSIFQWVFFMHIIQNPLPEFVPNYLLSFPNLEDGYDHHYLHNLNTFLLHRKQLISYTQQSTQKGHLRFQYQFPYDLNNELFQYLPAVRVKRLRI